MYTLPSFQLTNIDASGLASLTSNFTAQAASSTYITMLVHPTTTDTPLRIQASQILTRVLDVACPRDAKMDKVWTFTRKRKQRGDDSDEEVELNQLVNESLFCIADGVWDVIEWAFYKAEGGWVDVLNHIVRLLRNDFDRCMEGLDFGNCSKDGVFLGHKC